MKSVTTHNILNNIPVISISHKGLEAIKQIVKIAPQEAQWFHTVEPVLHKDHPNEVHLHLSEKIYIPSQNTSAVQVDTTSSMMMDFYKDLKKDYEDQETVNNKLSAMTCWCHSHHVMSPNPSAQDDSQFNSFITLAEDQNAKAWQIMLIFNKKDQFYSRVYDPQTRLVHEGVPIHVIHDYDFSYIHQAAKTKFIKPKTTLKQFSNWGSSKTKYQNKSQANLHDYKNDFLLHTQSSVAEYGSDINDDIATAVLVDVFDNYNIYIPPKNQFSNSIILNEIYLKKLRTSLYATFDEREIVLFTAFASGKSKQIPGFFLETAFNKKFPTIEHCFTYFNENLKDLTFTIHDAYEALIKTLEIVDLQTRKECKDYINNDGII
jgi:hypothetical protein